MPVAAMKRMKRSDMRIVREHSSRHVTRGGLRRAG
jgi:hypothetical protein